MNNKLDEINRGIFKYQIPELVVSKEMIELSVGYGENHTGSIEILNSTKSFIKGIVYSSHEKVRIMKPSFGGINNTIEYKICKEDMTPGEQIEGCIDVVSDCGEVKIPYVFKIVDNIFESSIGPINNLNGFVDLAKKDYNEALIIFNSSQFVDIVLKNDFYNELLYRSLRKGATKILEMENFFIATKKKEPILLTADKDKITVNIDSEDVEEKIAIRRSTWGYLKLNVRTNCDFIDLDVDTINDADFNDDIFELKFRIKKDLVNKTSIGKIYIQSIEQNFIVNVTCNCLKKSEEVTSYNDIKRYRYQFIKNYLDFRTGKMILQDYTENSSDIIQKLCKLENNSLNELLRIHLLIIEGKTTQAIELLNELEHKFDEKDRVDTIERCGYLYLKTLVSNDDMIIRISANTIMNFYEGDYKVWPILWILLYVNKKYDNNIGLKINDIREQYNLGCTSPIMYYEACSVYNKECMLLRSLGEFEIQAINWGAINNCISEDVARIYASLAVRIKEFNNIVYNTLARLYDKYELIEILSAICSILIKGEKYQNKYFKWFSKGVKAQLKITYLYEGYMYSYDENGDEPLQEAVLFYFNYNSNLADSRKAYLYAHVIQNKENNSKTYAAYKNQIKTFMMKQLRAHVINENMKVIYDDMLTNDLIDEEVAKELPYIMFRHDIICDNPNFVGVVIVNKILALEQYISINEGKAQVNIFADDTEIYLVDENANRYYNKDAYCIKKLFNCENYIDRCYELNPNDGMLIIYIGDKINNYIREDFKGLKIRKKIVEIPHIRNEYKRKYLFELIKHTYDNGEMDLLDHYLCVIDISKMNHVDRSYVIEYLIVRGFREKALEAIKKYGYSKIPIDRLVKLATKSVNNLLDEKDAEIVLKVCAFVFENKAYNEDILRYLVDNYNGSTRRMYKIWKVAHELNIKTTEIEERILAQILFTEGYVPDSVEIFNSYYRNYNNVKVVKAFLMYNSYKYIVKDRVLPETIFDIIKKELSYKNNEIYLMALLKYYSSKEDLTLKELEFVDNSIKYFGMKNVILPFFKDFGDKLRLPEYIVDKYYVSYITNPNIDVNICYRLEDDKNEDEFIEEKMRDVFLGIRVKEFILFFGDNLQYYVIERDNGQETITESFNICIDNNEDDESRYNKINFLLMTRDMNDEVTLIEAMKNLAVTDYIADNIFKPL